MSPPASAYSRSLDIVGSRLLTAESAISFRRGLRRGPHTSMMTASTCPLPAARNALDGAACRPRSRGGAELGACARASPTHDKAPFTVALNATLGLRSRHHESRRALHPGGQTIFEAFLDSLGLLARFQAGVERGAIEPERARVLAELLRGKGILILEESVVHLPILALVASAVGGLGGLARLRMNLIERIVPKHEAQLPCVDVVALERRQRRREEPATEGTLIVGKLHERHGCIMAAKCWRVRQARARRAGHRGGPAGDGALLHEPQDLADLALDVCEIGLETIEVRLDCVEVPRRPRWRLRPDRPDHQH